MDDLKQKTIHSAKWNFFEKVITLGFEFTVGIVLARLLMPADFGTIAITSVIISFILIFVNSGFSQSLIRDPDVSNNDYSTIFIFNLIIGILFYIIIYSFSSNIANYYQDSDLSLYVRVLGLSILISSLTFVQRVTLTRKMNFALIAKINILSSLASGILALVMAYSGYNIWSLIVKVLFNQFIQTCLLWFYNSWKPSITFNLEILKRHFRFGSKFLLSAIIGQVYNNILSLSIGKIYNLQTLGYYNRAQLFSNIISINIESIMTGVSFPALAKVQDDKEKFLRGVRLLIKQAFYVIGILMVMVFFSSKIIIPFLLGEQWKMTGIYLQYLCVIGFFGVLNSILVNSISVTGRSDIYLYFQIWALFINILSLILGYFYGIEVMLSSLIGTYILSYILISTVFNLLFKYSIFNQINDFRSIIIVLLAIIVINLIFTFSFNGSIVIILLSIFFQIISIIILSSILNVDEFYFIKNIFKNVRQNQKYTNPI